MDFKKNCGVVFILLGIILTLDKTDEFHGIVETIIFYVSNYWPMLMTVVGIYLISSNKKQGK